MSKTGKFVISSGIRRIFKNRSVAVFNSQGNCFECCGVPKLTSQLVPGDAVARENGSITSLLAKVPAQSVGCIEIDCPIKLEGKGGRWHSFRVESVDQFGNESINEVVPYFVADLPPPPKLVISHNTQTGLLSFRITDSE